MITPKQKFLQMLEALSLLAAPGSTQLAAFPKYVCRPDEILLTVDDAFGQAKDLVETGLLGREIFDLLEKLNGLMDELQNAPDDVWSEEAVLQHPLWEALRVCAREALKRHDLQLVAIRLEWIKYSPGGEQGVDGES